MEDIKNKVEAILFAAGRSVKLKEFAAMLDLQEHGLIKESIKDLKNEYDERNSPIMLIEEGEGWKLHVQERYLPVVRRINPHTELSKAVMETLAVVAWKSPMIQSDVIKIRTNKAYEHIAELESLGFLTKERFGRSFKLRPTQKFMDYFDLPDNESVKKLFKEFKDIEFMAKNTMKDTKDEEPKEEEPKEDEQAPPEELGDLQVYNESEETEPEVIPDEEQVHLKESVGDLEVFEESETQPEEQQEESQAGVEEEPESDADKARRLAQELLEEESQEEDHTKDDDRKLHPVLEEFLDREERTQAVEEPTEPETQDATEESDEEPTTEDVAEGPSEEQPEETDEKKAGEEE